MNGRCQTAIVCYSIFWYITVYHRMLWYSIVYVPGPHSGVSGPESGSGDQADCAAHAEERSGFDPTHSQIP